MNKVSKRVALGLVMLLTTGLLAGCGTQDKMGYVDIAKVKVETTKGKAIKGKIEAKQKEVYERLQKLEQTESQDKFQQDLMKGRQEVQMYGLAMSKEFENSVQASVAQIARDKQLTVVLDKQAVASGGEDITDEVIARMNKDSKDAGTDGTATDATAGDGKAQPAGDAKKDDAKK